MSYRPPIKPPLGARVNWSHPWANGLACYFLANEKAGKLRDIARQRAVDARESPVAPTWTTGSGGASHYDTRQWYATDSALQNATSVSCLVALHDLTSNAAPRTPILGIWDGVDIDQKNFRLEVDGGTLVNDSWNLIFEGGRSQFTFNIRPAGYHVWGFVINGATGSSSAYRDGVFVEAAPTEVGTYFTVGSTHAYPFVGAPAASTGISIVASAIWTRALTPAEMCPLTADPYAFISQPSNRRYSVRATAVAAIARARRAKRRPRPTPIWIGR